MMDRDFLGQVFRTGEAVPAEGQYQLVGDDHNPVERIDDGRVVYLREGQPFPAHPDSGSAAEWRFMRVAHNLE